MKRPDESPPQGKASLQSDEIVRERDNWPEGEPATVLGSATGGLAAAAVAVFAALCCVGPSTVALLGAGGALAAASLKPYRLILLVASLLMIAYGFWRVYGQRTFGRDLRIRACPIRVGRFTRIALWLAAFVWLLAALLPFG